LIRGGGVDKYCGSVYVFSAMPTKPLTLHSGQFICRVSRGKLHTENMCGVYQADKFKYYSFFIVDMKKIIIVLIFAVLFSGFVYAKGGSSGGSVTRDIPKQPDCESFKTMTERIECRLEYGQQYKTTPEPCRPLTSQQRCIDAYKDSQQCYDMKGTAKDKCFKEVAGFTEITVEKEVQMDESNVRYYIVLLLYDLEERVEEAVEDSLMSEAQGALLISEIVDVKKMVLQESAGTQNAFDDIDAGWPRILI
jgi:hypothetical protein